MAKTIKFRPTQDITVKKAKNSSKLQLRVADDVLNGNGIEPLRGLHTLALTSESPDILEEDFTVNPGDELTVIVTDFEAIKAGDDIGNGTRATADREAFKRFEVVGYTPAEQVIKMERLNYQRAIAAQQLNNSKAITAATIEGIKSGKIQPATVTSDELNMTDKW